MLEVFATDLRSQISVRFLLLSLTMDDQRIAYTIHQVIKSHEGRPTKHPTLNPHNERRIIQKVASSIRLRDELLDTVNKRDYYVKKLNRLLEKVIEGEGASSISEASNSKSKLPKLDPQFITDRTNAKAYVERVLLENPSTATRLKEEMTYHYKLQEDWKSEREEIVEKFRLLEQVEIQQVLRKLEGYHPSKANKMKEKMMSEALAKWQADFDAELQTYDEKVMFSAQLVASKNTTTLEGLKIPFFCIDKEHEYLDLKKDKVYILETIQEIMKRS